MGQARRLGRRRRSEENHPRRRRTRQGDGGLGYSPPFPLDGGRIRSLIAMRSGEVGWGRWRVLRPPSQAETAPPRSEEHTSELQSLMRISYAAFCLKKKKNQQQ